MSTTHDDVTGQHPGAAFGIPEGAEGEEVVDAVFGDARPSEGLEALRAELAAQAEGRIAGIEGIDPALMPYLEAAQEEDSLVGPDGSLTLAQVREAGISQAEREAAQEEEDLQALRELGLEVATGRFGAKMQVSLTNNGPVTLLLDTDSL